MLSKEKLLAQELRGLAADLAQKKSQAWGFLSGHATPRHATQDKTRERVELERERQTQLTAPVAGVIQQLAIHTTSGVADLDLAK